MEGHILYEMREGDYGVITLNHPTKRNAISYDMAVALERILEEIKARPMKCLVIKSAGNATFCAGGNLNDFHADLSKQDAYELLHLMQRILFAIAAFPVPTICVMQGNAYGGGCELATACDVRIAKAGTQFGFIQSTLGILPAWGGGALLYEKVLPSFAVDWIIAGEMYPAETLMEKGWISKIVPADEWGNELHILKSYLSRSIEQMRFAKQGYQSDARLEEIQDNMKAEISRTAHLWGSLEHQRCVNRFLKK